MSRLLHSRLLGSGAAAAIAITVAACDADRSSVLEPSGSNSINFVLNRPAASNLPGGSVIVTKPATGAGTVRFRLRGLERLTTGVYAVWLGTQTGTAAADFAKARGHFRVIQTDTTLDAQGDPVITPDTLVNDSTSGVWAFTEGGSNITVELTVNSTLFGADPLTKNLALISIEADSTGPTEPGSVRPLWAGYTVAANNTQTLRFGNFAPDPADAYIYFPTGRGRVSIRDGIILVNDSSLARPPVGYYYAAHIVKRDSATSVAMDTVALGAQTAPWPRREVSLRNADVELVDQVVQAEPPSILAAANRVMLDTLGLTGFTPARPFRDYANVWVTLETKRGDESAASPTVILAAAFPDALRFQE
jgi:hypothetical protein